MDLLEHKAIKNVVILSVVLEEVKHRSTAIYKRIRAVISNPDKQFYVFSNEYFRCVRPCLWNVWPLLA